MMNLKQLKQFFLNHNCNRIYIKKLSPNDNSKNQIYFGGSFEVINIFPFSDIQADNDGDWKRARFKAQTNFAWLQENGSLSTAPDTQLILYPKYPEVRLSGFLHNAKNSPSDLLQSRAEGRILILGISENGRIIGYVIKPGSNLANEILSMNIPEKAGVFSILPLSGSLDTRKALLNDLKHIHEKGWLKSKRLRGDRSIADCNSSNCGGYTLEAELGVTPNGYSDPDYLGWEIKQFNVVDFDSIYSSVITLMTPEPTGGFYTEKGIDRFILKYGYKDKMGRADRMNFGGIHYCNSFQESTGLKLILNGFDNKSGKIRNPEGAIELIDKKENVAASWAFSSLLKHWKRKHAKAAYIPSMCKVVPQRQYFYGNKIILGEDTTFQFFLKQMFAKNIYYDPGIKMEHVSSKHKIKRRSQFRIKSKFLPTLYSTNEIIDLDKI